MFSHIWLEQQLLTDYPLRPIRLRAGEALAQWSRIEEVYTATGRPSILPEKRQRTLLGQLCCYMQQAHVDEAAR